jgi:hypothetical protein
MYRQGNKMFSCFPEVTINRRANLAGPRPDRLDADHHQAIIAIGCRFQIRQYGSALPHCCRLDRHAGACLLTSAWQSSVHLKWRFKFRPRVLSVSGFRETRYATACACLHAITFHRAPNSQKNTQNATVPIARTDSFWLLDIGTFGISG